MGWKPETDMKWQFASPLSEPELGEVTDWLTGSPWKHWCSLKALKVKSLSVSTSTVFWDITSQCTREGKAFLLFSVISLGESEQCSVGLDSLLISSCVHSFLKEAFICVWGVFFFLFFFLINTQLIPVSHVNIDSTWVCKDYGCPFWQTISFNSIVCS